MKRFLPLFTLATFLPVAASAHVRWFVDETIPAPDISVPMGLIVGWIVLSIGVLLLASVLQCTFPAPAWRTKVTEKQRNIVEVVLWVLVTLWFVLNVQQGVVLVPVFVPETVVGEWLMWAQYGLAGMLLLSAIWRKLLRFTGLLFVLFFVAAGMTFGPLEIFEHLFVAGLGFYLLLRYDPNFAPYAVPVLRVTTGFSLVALGLGEKLFALDLGMQFLQHHDWNFMQLIGFETFSDISFVVSAGMTEVLIGLVFLVGWITRLNTLALGVVLVTTASLLGIHELIGHLPIFGIAAILLLDGSGQRLTKPLCALLPSFKAVSTQTREQQ